MLAQHDAPEGWPSAIDDDWIEAGFAALADGGPNALRIDALCDRLSVTKGSFYWHFTDMAAYRAALVEAWGSLHDRNRRPFENMRASTRGNALK